MTSKRQIQGNRKEYIRFIQPNKFTIETKLIQLFDIRNQPLETISELIKKQKWKTWEKIQNKTGKAA